MACLALAIGAMTANAASGVTARLVLPVSQVQPGESFLAGIELTAKPGWHTYWRNGGDSGAPTTIEWTLPKGFAAGDILWPAPERYIDQDLVTFVHHGTTTLLVPITVEASAPRGPVALSALVKWLECEKLCVPGKATVQASLTVGGSSVASADATPLAAARAKIPTAAAAGSVSASWEGEPTGDDRSLLIHWRNAPGSGTADFLPHGNDAYVVATATELVPGAAGEITLRKKVSRVEGDWPATIPGLLARFDARQVPVTAAETVLQLGPSNPVPQGVTAPPAPTGPPAPRSAAAPTLSLPQAIGMGLLGGLILNIMPCVLPVIALKILGFVRQAGSRPGEIRRLGLIYALGVWVSFLVLAILVIAVKRAAGIASWGMQFGSPVFLVAMSALVLLVALSLFGVFEINVTGRALDHAGELASREGAGGAFFNGVLAVALATPCTAPFLAPALGYAFAAPASTIVVIFSAVAIGLASPYVLLSFKPGWLKFLPKPGVWMERFKIAMGFPMLATAIWLYSLAAKHHFQEEGSLGLGLFLVGLALSAWVWGEFVQRGRSRKGLAMAVSILILAAFYVLVLERELHWRSPRQATAPATDTEAGGRGTAAAILALPPVRNDRIQWQPWSRSLLQELRGAGRPILVDFTAEWCQTCKFNERRALEIPEVRSKLEATRTIVLKADQTKFPPEIAEELQRFGQAGVPLVLVYPRDAKAEPQILPSFLSPADVLDALEAAAR